ncbi:MAG: putative ABC transporter ATP-binding protein YxlF [Chloroflexi bacterium ADurb.Bin180]|nr:MAG: putative ABC transporter ATP-binding protein YxlF [Chloroflexi bacterium ADurb.Bin180]HNT05966.1 ATP-binding cassette domain-containing protein [Anaerolineae bacterium]HQJ51270.1 ATP-binding cassette domain-containing protein [Anaerolineae bacterium]
MLQVSELKKNYGAVEALRGVSFEIAEGEVVGLLGPNGAGKTTIMKILTGYLQPDEGSVRIGGLDVLTQTRQVQALIGYLPENAPLYPELSIQDYMLLMAELRQIPAQDQMARLSEAVYATNLQDHLARDIGTLSKGFRQRVGLAQAILHRPRLLILDEPTLGLDPTQVVEIRRLIRGMARHSTVLFSTHILSEVEALCDRVIILLNGQVKTDARLADLAATPNALLVLTRKANGAETLLKALTGVKDVQYLETPEGYASYRILGRRRGQKDICPAIYDLAREQGWGLRELRRDVRTLESVFNDLATAA